MVRLRKAYKFGASKSLHVMLRTLVLYCGRCLFALGGLMVIGGFAFILEPYFFVGFPNNVLYGIALFFIGASVGGLGRLLQWLIYDNWPT